MSVVDDQSLISNRESLLNLKSKFCKGKNNSGFVKIAHINAENLQVHYESVLELFEENLFDVLVISETFLKPAVSSKPYCIEGYNFIRHDREGKEGGGLGIYIKKMFNYKIIATSQAQYNRKPEFVIFEVSLGWKLLVCATYKPPKLGHISDCFDLIGNLLPTYTHFLMLGDFNINLSTDRVFYEKTQFLDLVRSIDLKILPFQPTHHLPNSDTWLDLLLCNDLSIVNNFGQVSLAGLSYHDMIYVELNLKVKIKTNKEKIKFRDYKNMNSDLLKQECALLEWNDLYLSNNIDCKVELFSNKINNLFEKFVPEREVLSKKRPCPWISNEIRSQMIERDKVYRRYIRTKNSETWEIYRELRNRVKRLLRDSRNKFFQNCLQPAKSSKNLWSVIKSQGIGKSSSEAQEPVVDLNSLNSFFVV